MCEQGFLIFDLTNDYFSLSSRSIVFFASVNYSHGLGSLSSNIPMQNERQKREKSAKMFYYG